MIVRDEPRMPLPEEQQKLLRAYGRFLRSMTELTQPANLHRGDGPAAFVLYVMWLREVQLGRAVQEICINGFAQEAQMVARAMIGEALDVMFISQADSDRRALLYASYARTVQRKRAKALVLHGHL